MSSSARAACARRAEQVDFGYQEPVLPRQCPTPSQYPVAVLLHRRSTPYCGRTARRAETRGPLAAAPFSKSPSGEVLATESLYLGHTTNNIAEYRALLLGLERALRCGIKHIEVRADSELLIKQLRGEYRVKNEGLKPLFEAAKQLLSRFQTSKLTHVRREHNTEADRLANRGIDERSADQAELGQSGSSSGDK
ncbi:MAG: ribonuclease HI family protein [Polyangiaceae bacterium]